MASDISLASERFIHALSVDKTMNISFHSGNSRRLLLCVSLLVHFHVP